MAATDSTDLRAVMANDLSVSGPDDTADLSVIIPAYDRLVLIRETIDSVLAQTVPPREIIVVDNGPLAEEHRRLVDTYGGRVRYLRSEPRGVIHARNAGIRHASSRWIVFLDDDDLWSPGFLAIAREAMRDPRVGFIGADHVKFEGAAKEPETNFERAPPGYWDGIPRPEPGKDYSFVGKFPLDRLLRRIPFYPSSGLVRRDVALAVGGFDPQVAGFITDDIEFLIRALTASELAIIWKPMMEYRLHAGNVSRGRNRQSLSRWKVFEFAYRNHRDLDPAFRAALERDLPQRREDAFEVAFATDDHATVKAAWARLEPAQRTWRRRLRRAIVGVPQPWSNMLKRRLVRSYRPYDA